jgi:hypothetical protein
MRIKDTHIIVPQDETGDYPGSWRHKVAVALVDNPGVMPEYPELLSDDFVQDHMAYLQLDTDAQGGTPLSSTLRAHHVASTWHMNDDLNSPRFRIEPMLLTGAGYDVIASDIGNISAASVEAYEKLFFNTRAADGTLGQGCYTRQRLAIDETVPIGAATPTDVIWRMCAFSMGYEGLVSLWHWEKHATGLDGRKPDILSEVMREFQVTMLNSVLRRDINAFDLNNVFGNYIQHQRMLFDTKQEVGGVRELSSMMLGFLQVIQPKLAPAARKVDDEIGDMVANAAIQERLQAQRNISQTKLQGTPGAGHEAITEMLVESAGQKFDLPS